MERVLDLTQYLGFQKRVLDLTQYFGFQVYDLMQSSLFFNFGFLGFISALYAC